MAEEVSIMMKVSLPINANPTQIKAFWSKVDITENIKDCWVWTGARKPKGYGNVRIGGRYFLSHRAAFELTNGPIPVQYSICHTCDNPSCCNPHHLMLGTVKSNSADMLMKNRQKKFSIKQQGGKNGNAKLNDSAVAEIRRKHRANELNQKQLAEAYGVSATAIGSIIRNETWRHVNG